MLKRNASSCELRTQRHAPRRYSCTRPSLTARVAASGTLVVERTAIVPEEDFSGLLGVRTSWPQSFTPRLEPRIQPANVARLQRRLRSSSPSLEVDGGISASKSHQGRVQLSDEEQAGICRLIQTATKAQEDRTQRLSVLQHQQLVQAAHTAQTKLLRAHLGLLVKMAKRYQSGKGASFDDILLAGVQGLLEAAKKFDTRQPLPETSIADSSQRVPARFIYFAQFYIRKHMILALRSLYPNDVCYIPRYLTDRRAKVAAVYYELQSERGQGARPSAVSVAKRTGLPVVWVEDILSTLTTRVVSAEQTTEDDDDDDGGIKAAWRMDPYENASNAATSTTHGVAGGSGGRVSLVGLAVTVDPDLDPVDAPNRQKQFQELVSRVLSAKESEAVQAMLQSGTQEGQSQVAKRLGVSRQALSERYERAVKRLREACASDPELRNAFEEWSNSLDA